MGPNHDIIQIYTKTHMLTEPSTSLISLVGPSAVIDQDGSIRMDRSGWIDDCSSCLFCEAGEPAGVACGR